MLILLLALAGLLLAYANGANDNFKGVATLFGSGTTDNRRALAWATATTLLGSLTAVFLAGKLLANFSGKGLVDDSLVANADYTAAVALGAALTVLLATRIGMPISTTHSLVGSLVGTGMAAGSTIDLTQHGEPDDEPHRDRRQPIRCPCLQRMLAAVRCLESGRSLVRPAGPRLGRYWSLGLQRCRWEPPWVLSAFG